MQLRTIALVLLAGAVSSACTPTYVSPRTGPVAQVSVSQSALYGYHAKLMVSDPNWSRRADITGGIFYTYDKPVNVPAGAGLYMEIQTDKAMGAGHTYCGMRFSFLPEEGHRYVVTPSITALDGTMCRVSVVDEATGRAPPSYERHPVPSTWRPAD